MTGWTTRQVAEKCGLSQHTLRWYERIGLLDRVARTADGRRRYSDADVDWILLLSRLRATGMPVRDMLRYAGLVRSGAGSRSGWRCWKPTASTSARPCARSRSAWNCSITRSRLTRAASARPDQEQDRSNVRNVSLGGLTVSAQGLGCMGMSEWYGAARLGRVDRDHPPCARPRRDVHRHGRHLRRRAQRGPRRPGLPAGATGPARHQVRHRPLGRRRQARHPRRARLRQAGLRVVADPAGRGRDRPVLPAPAAADRGDRGDRRRHGGAGRRGQGALPGPVRGGQRAAAPGPRGAPDRGGAERVLAVGPGPGDDRPRRAARAGRRPGRRTRRWAGAS